ncbi:MAG: helix-turn-helix domain-containing protein [Kosmotoga sp.]|nr:MAG: helix-turn-helix domain-containing protein [Kosmotoga sp.]
MKGRAMYYTVKTMLDHGKSISGIARDLEIDRKIVRNIRNRVKNEGIKTPVTGSATSMVRPE